MPLVRPDRVALAGSMSEFVENLLAETPQVRDAARQAPLTARFLAPAVPALEALFRHLRADVDPVLRRTFPAGAKPYPLGRCREITEAVQARLAAVDPADLPRAAAEGLAAISAFQAAGGSVHAAWGDLRGRYFQNALIAGALYVDVANDTVVMEKPPVEILPFAEAGFRPISGYGHFARIAASYWGLRLLPNHLLPGLAPYLPLIQIDPQGAVRLGPSSRVLLGRTLAAGFRPSEAALAAAPLPPGLFAGLRGALADGSDVVAASPQAGRAAALAACAAFRDEGLPGSAAAYNRAMAAARRANRRLAGLRVVRAQRSPQPAAAG